VRLYAWAHGLTLSETIEHARRFPGLGLVLNHRNVDAAFLGDLPAPIVYVNGPEAAAAVRVAVDEGAVVRAVIAMDERNADGPSGHYLEPVEYKRRYHAIRVALDGAAPLFTMGLQATGGWVRTFLWCRRFDDAYHAQLPEADGRAFNPNKVRFGEARRVLRLPGPWILSPAPFRSAWDRFWEPVSVPAWARISTHANVTAVALWCLRETVWGDGTPQAEHGLLDREERVTTVGRDVLRALGGGS
jgi:hypothetical protein